MTDADGFELLRNNLLTIGLVEPNTSAREIVELCMSFIIGNKEAEHVGMNNNPPTTPLRYELFNVAGANSYERHAEIMKLHNRVTRV